MNETVHRAKAGAGRDSGRTNDPERTRADIVDVATQEFSEKGLAGARIDEIAAATRTSKRMIYYYFGNKEGLYLAVLEESYRRMREAEAQLALDDLDPVNALRRLIEFTFDHHRQDERHVRLIMSENIARGQYLAQSPTLTTLNAPVIDRLRRLYQRGVDAGVFRAGLDPLDLHASLSALAFFNVSNEYTFGLAFGIDMRCEAYAAQRRASVVDMVLRHVCA